MLSRTIVSSSVGIISATSNIKADYLFSLQWFQNKGDYYV